MSDTTLGDVTNNIEAQSQRVKAPVALGEKDSNAQLPAKNKPTTNKDGAKKPQTTQNDDYEKENANI
jgi:hypothetical protein